MAVSDRRWLQPITATVRLAFEPPRQVWLATLGGTAVVLRTARAAWGRLVAEGTEIESWLRDLRSRA